MKNYKCYFCEESNSQYLSASLHTDCINLDGFGKLMPKDERDCPCDCQSSSFSSYLINSNQMDGLLKCVNAKDQVEQSREIKAQTVGPFSIKDFIFNAGCLTTVFGIIAGSIVLDACNLCSQLKGGF